MSPNDLHEKFLPTQVLQTQEELQRDLDRANEKLRATEHALLGVEAHCKVLTCSLETAESRLLVAEQALRAAGFTQCEGPARWKPPLGKSAAPTLEGLDQTRQAGLALALASLDLCSVLVPHQFTPDNTELRQRLLKVLNLSIGFMEQQP